MANNGPRFQARDVHNAEMINNGFYASVVDSIVNSSYEYQPIAVCADIETAQIIAHALNHLSIQEELGPSC
jgi:hypothetical protein